MDPLSVLVDEVALEGLDGITLPTLWIRLEDRKPKFPLKLDDVTQEFIWKSLISNADMKFYQLPKERDDLVLFDRFKDIDPETGIETTQSFSQTRKEIYPVHIILENKNGIQGSCAVFKERTDVTKHVRSKSLSPLLSLQEALERFGRKLVVVASQSLRFRTLIGTESDPDLKLNDDSFCVLERVGRGRWQGELQRDLHGCSFKIDARKLHYMRKSLIRFGLITMQPHVERMKSGQQQHSILLLLKRFHVNRRTKYDMLMEYVSNLLQESPGQFATLLTLKDQLSNVDDCTFKRVFQYLRAAKLVEYCRFPLEDFDPAAGPCTNKKGNKVQVRCVRLLKPYTRKGVVEDDDDEDEDDDTGARSRALPSEGRLMETDILTQAYHIVLSSGTKGIPQRSIGVSMNVGKLEARMICRRLERDDVIKGFMVDEGRQRTTKFISHKWVGVSNQLQLVAKEQERKKLLYSSAKTPSTPKSKSNTQAAKKTQKAGGAGGGDAEEAGQTSGDGGGETAAETGRKSAAKRKKAKEKSSVKPNQKLDVIPIMLLEPLDCETQTSSKSTTSETPDSAAADEAEEAPDEEEESSSSPSGALPLSEAASNPVENNVVLVEDVYKLQAPPRKKSKWSVARSHETYRLLRRRNLIIEAVRNLRIIEGLFPLQKIINDEEKKGGLSSKCCRKTILRLVDSLSREGLLKVYKTTVIQDGITKKLEMVVHPSIQPNDEIVSRVIEQVRFKISSSYSAVRLQHAAEMKTAEAREKEMWTKGDDFKPTTVRGLGKTFGFQPKMHRLRLVHNFLWYLIYGHPNRNDPTDSASAPTPAVQNAKHPEDSANGQTQPSESAASGSTDQQTADSSPSNLDVSLSGDEEEEVQKDKTTPGHSSSHLKVYAEGEAWKRFIPPVRVHKEFGDGWAMVGDLLLCLPLSIFIQVIQINYKVDGLEDYLNDPVKQHHLVRALPARMKRQLLYKRKYIFAFHENLQKLVYMGLLQFGPMEKFKEKDQVFLYLRRHASIVDTTSAEPHYWLATESPDKPFERRQYTFNTPDDVENYWFDLMCVCLNTPLGVIRNKRNTDEETAPSFVLDRSVFVGMAYLLKGCREVCDDGVIPGDGKGAGGLDSEFFGHLKRNWLWTNHLLSVKTIPSGSEVAENKIRLKSLLSKNALRIALKAGGTTTPHYVTDKRPLVTEIVEVDVEPASRNQQVVGGKKQKRKRTKKEVVKAPRKKKKEPKKRTPAHDETDHQALKMMTRRRVYWSIQEDSLVMLCSVAAQLLNSKLKRPYVPYCVVRDLLHAEFEISMDKTSVAVGRRTRYILKNPQTLLNYRICLAEVYQDKPLMGLLEAKKPADPDNPDDCGKSFSEYTRLLRQKFSSVLLSNYEMIIPDTKRQLFSRFKVSAIENAKRVSWKDTLTCSDDIHTIVLHNLIQGTLAMTNCQMKSSRSFQTFQMYSRYNQELLCQVFIQCRKRGLVNRRRINQPFGPKKNRALPILPMSYQLSQSYYRCFSWRFPHSLCTDSFRFLRSLMNNGTGDDRAVTAFYHETEHRSANGEEVMERRPGSERKRRQRKEGGGRAVAEPEKGDGSESTQVEQKNLEVSLAAPSSGELPGGEQAEDRPPKEELGHAPDGSPDVASMLPFSMESPGAACVVSLSLMSLGLLSVFISIPKQMVVVDSNLVDNDVVKSMAALEEDDDDDDDGEECEGRKKLQVKAHQASHTNYLMMRGYCFPGIVKIRNLNTSDNIVVESCIMRLQMRNTPAHHVFSLGNSPPLDLTKCGPSLLPAVLSHSIRSSSSSSSSPNSAKECDDRLTQRGYTPQDVEACAELRRSLDAAGENGLDQNDFYQTHEHLEEPRCGRTRSLQQYMMELQEEGQVVKVGGLGVRWVLLQHADPWLLTVNSKQWSQSRLTSARLPFLENDHNIPFMRKRTMRGAQQEADEPAAKKTSVDKQGGVGGDAAREKPDEEEERLEKQEERADEGSGDTSLQLEDEGGKLMQPKEESQQEAGQEEQTQGRREKRPRRVRLDSVEDEARSPPTRPCGDDNSEKVSFISRPWRMVDGNLNRQVCKGMLEAILYHVMFRPGLTQQALVEHYKDVLQPLAVLDLVQALIDMGCLTKKALVRTPKPSLFARSAPQTSPTEAKVKTEQPDLVFYEPTISCCLRLSQMLPNERHWNYCLP